MEVEAGSRFPGETLVARPNDGGEQGSRLSYVTSIVPAAIAVPGSCELQQQRRERDRGRMLKVVRQHHAFAALVELGHDRGNHLAGILGLEVEGTDIRRKDAGAPFGEIGGLAWPRTIGAVSWTLFHLPWG
jgi:hypothetical protein